MRQKLQMTVLALLVSLFMSGFSQPSFAQTKCDPCADIPWGAEQIHQFYFNPSDYPTCLAFAEIHYRTKYCNGMLMYELTFVEYTFISGGCCQFAHLYKDVEKEMILNVLGTPNVMSSKPSSCYRELELDPHSDPDFIDCWTHHGELPFDKYNMIVLSPCSKVCCLAKVSVKYDPRGRPIIFWDPITTDDCGDPSEPPKEFEITICCQTVIDSTGEAICTDFKTFKLKVLAADECRPYCDRSIFFRKVPGENQDLIQENINFLRDTKAYPNPFGSSLNLSISLPESQSVPVEILDMHGKLVKQFNLQYEKGRTEYQLDGLGDLSSGVYLCRIVNQTYGNKVIKVKKQ